MIFASSGIECYFRKNLLLANYLMELKRLSFLFEEDKDLAEVFSQKFVRTIAAIRRVEYNAYLKVISSWEREFLLLNV